MKRNILAELWRASNVHFRLAKYATTAPAMAPAVEAETGNQPLFINAAINR